MTRQPARPSHRPSFVLPLAVLVLAACTSSDGSDATSREDDVVRAVAAAHFAEEHFHEAAETLRPLVERSDPNPQDLVRAAIVAFELHDFDAARTHLDAAAAKAPDDAAVLYNQGRLALADIDFERAAEMFRRAHEAVPNDYPTHLAYANALAEVDLERALEHYAALREVGLDYSGSWYLTTTYRMGRAYAAIGSFDESDALMREYEQLKAQDITVPADRDLAQGTLGALEPPPPSGSAVPLPTAPGALGDAVALAGGAGSLRLIPAMLFEDWREGMEPEERAEVRGNDLVAFGEGGVWFFEQSGGSWSANARVGRARRPRAPLRPGPGRGPRPVGARRAPSSSCSRTRPASSTARASRPASWAGRSAASRSSTSITRATSISSWSAPSARGSSATTARRPRRRPRAASPT